MAKTKTKPGVKRFEYTPENSSWAVPGRAAGDVVEITDRAELGPYQIDCWTDLTPDVELPFGEEALDMTPTQMEASSFE